MTETVKTIIKRTLLITVSIILLISVAPFVTSCSSGNRTVMTIGDYNVSYDMLRYFAMNYINSYEGVSEEDFINNEELQKQLYNNVTASLCEIASYALLAKKHDISLTKDEKKSIKKEIKDIKASYKSKDEYKKDLEANFMTEDVYEEIVRVEALCDKLYDYLTSPGAGMFDSDNETIDADIEKGNFFSAEYSVLYYTEKNKEERKAFMQNMLDTAKSGASLRDLCDDAYVTYGEELAYEFYSAFTYTEKTELFENTVKALDIGEYSKVEDTGNSFLIVRRLDLDEDYIDKNYNTIIAKYLSREFFGYIDNYADSLDIKFKKGYEDLKLWEMK